MELHVLKFAKISILRADIAEVIINDDVVMTLAMVNEYHGFLQKHLRAPFSLLVNKINEYGYEFQAQLAIGNIPEIHAMAVVSYTRKSNLTTHLLAHTTPRTKAWNIDFFSQRDMALEWLETQQDALKQHGKRPVSNAITASLI
ncbi:hypothetical protein [Paraglaciecola sp.]|uniref:hypothetical protein n=1 Tax=Paraglaciecola sp. TaxID=1920173 RepID=UPI00273E492E|nr:hypothetical protein [Paraglaciecola sp.]MDP5033225.1 hypothetical protein [Paraglaciecola sp.]